MINKLILINLIFSVLASLFQTGLKYLFRNYDIVFLKELHSEDYYLDLVANFIMWFVAISLLELAMFNN